MAVKRYDGSAWQVVAGKGDQGTSSSIATWVKTASGGETSLSGNDDNSQPLSYTVGQELVFINGALQKRGVDYTATTGTSITGLTALVANDVVTVWTVNAFSVANTYTQAQVDAAFVNNTNYWAAGKNFAIGGGFDFWQRGTSLALTSSYVYLADRFKTNGRNGTGTQAQHTLTASESAICSNLKYAYKLDVTSAATTNKPRMITAIEDSQYFYGRTITVSFYAKASKSLTLETQADLVWANISNTSTLVSNSLTTTFQRFTYTFTLSPSGTYNSATDHLHLYFTAPQNDTYTIYITGVQAEFGSVATPFSRAGGTIQGELAACQRYFWKEGGSHNTPYGMGYVGSSTAVYGWIVTPTYMRKKDPTLSYSNIRATTAGVAGLTLSALVLRTTTGVASSNNCFGIEGTTTGAVAGRPVNFENNDTTAGYIQLDAEL